MPKKNGICERRNKTIVEIARRMLKNAKMDRKFWVYVVNIVVYMLNRIASKYLDRMIPEEEWIG